MKRRGGAFISVVHPVYGELCTNGSLNHTQEHRKLLDNMGCSYKKYDVPIIEWSDLIQHYNVKKCDLFVLDVEGNELKVIESMKKGNKRSLPKVFVVEHGHLNREEIISQVESMGYKYDTCSYVNSYFVKHSIVDRIRDWIAEKRHIEKIESEFFINAKRAENFREGEEVKCDFSDAIDDNKSFLNIAAVKEDDLVIVYSVSGIEGKSSDDQIVYYEIIDKNGQTRIFKTCLQLREDYAKMRNSNMYLKSGSRLIIHESVLSLGDYKIKVYLEQENVIYRVGERTLSIAQGYAQIDGE